MWSRKRGPLQELRALVGLLRERQQRPTTPVERVGRVPLHVNAHYTRDEVLAAFGHKNPSAMRQGVLWMPEERADILFVTLEKSERHYSPSTRYRDYAISEREFHWESQNSTSIASATGQRYINHTTQGSSVHLFIRKSKLGGIATPAYVYVGPVKYVSSKEERPMQIVWRLEYPLLPEMLERARVAV